MFLAWSQKGIDQIRSDGRFEKYGQPVVGGLMAPDIASELEMKLVDFAFAREVASPASPPPHKSIYGAGPHTLYR